MNKNTRAGLIPETILKDVLSSNENEWHCKALVEIACKNCFDFDSCAECIDYTLNWFYGAEAVNYDV